MNKYEREEARQREDAKISLKDIDAKITRMVSAVENGAEITALRARLIELETQRKAVSAKLQLGRHEPIIFRINPDTAELYRQKVSNIREALNADPETRVQATSILRSLIPKIVFHPGQRRGEMAIELHRQIAAVPALGQDLMDPEVMMTVVPGERCHRESTVLCAEI